MSISEALAKLAEMVKILLAMKEKLNPKKIPLRSLAEAMATFEGFYLIGSLANRNNNPGNLRWSPFAKGYDTKNNFAIFETKEKGWEAFLWDLGKKCRGETKTSLRPSSTLKDLIYTWSATDQAAYLGFVAERLGITFDFRIGNFY